MAFFQCNFFSPTLCFGTDVNVFIPTPNSDELLNDKDASYFSENARFPVVYLLHGAYGDYSDWFRLTSVEKYAQEHKLAVVAPSASNSFYQNMIYGSDYLRYITEELPQFIQKMFPVSQKREYTYTAGLSMGGYGAMRVALEKPENYSAAITLSGRLDLVELQKTAQSGAIPNPFNWEGLFADPAHLEGTDADIFALLAKRKKAGAPTPRIFQSCGREDFIYENNKGAREKFLAAGADLTYEEHPGRHDWDYWDTHIQRGFSWLGTPRSAVKE